MEEDTIAVLDMRESNEKRKLTFQDVLAACEKEGLKYGEESMMDHPFPWDIN